MKKKVLYASISLMILVMAIVSSVFLVYSKPEPKKDNAKVNSMYVKAETANIRETETQIKYRGRVSAYDQISLSSEVTGRIISGDVRLKAGETFNKGDIIIKIYSEDTKASLKSAKCSFLQIVSMILPDIKVDFNAEYEKWERFFNSIDPEAPLPELPKAASDKERVFLASNNVLTTYYTLQQQEIQLKKYTIRAPFDGTFKSVNKEKGAVASPGAELASIIRSDILEIIVPVFPHELQWIREGDEVVITDNNGENQNARISRISGYVDESTQSVNVYISYYPKKKNALLEGEYVDVYFSGGRVSGFKIPREAIIEGTYVYELKDNKLFKTKVEIGREFDDYAIVSNPDTNMLIVTESLSSVDSGVKYMAR